MKKFVFAVAGLCAVSAFAEPPRLDDSIRELNSIIADTLKPFQSNLTTGALEIKALTSDETRVLTLNVAGDYRHTGKVQNISIRVTNLAFNYDADRPVVTLAGDLGFDFVKAFTRTQINQFVDSWQSEMENMIKEKMKAYGPALSVKAIMIEKVKDRAGNYTSFRSSLAVNVDLTKLPSTMKAEDVPFLSTALTLRVDVSRGAMLEGSMRVNPVYKNTGMLKTKLELLLSRDPDSTKRLGDGFVKLDKFASGLSDTAAPRD